jgi:hypothetical protein
MRQSTDDMLNQIGEAPRDILNEADQMSQMAGVERSDYVDTSPIILGNKTGFRVFNIQVVVGI